MLARVIDLQRTVSAKRAVKNSAAKVIFATALAGLLLSAPITLDFSGNGFGPIVAASAYAKNHDNNGGGNAGGNGNGHGNGNGKGNGDSSASSGTANAQEPNGDGGRFYFLPDHPAVAVALFTTTIRKRHPANEVTLVNDPHQAVSFYSELHAMSGSRITHRWSYNGEVKFEASFDVLSERWRVWSTHLLPPELSGVWTVDIIGPRGRILETRHLNYRPDTEVIAEN